MTFLELAERVLREEGRPLTAEEIWAIAQERGYDKQVGSKGKTPWQTIGARLYMDIRDNPNSMFMKADVRPTRFTLKGFAGVASAPATASSSPPKAAYKERELHPFLTYFLYTYHTIYTKTIFHEESSKGRYAQWLHPDMVGVYFPLESWDPEVVEISEELGHVRLRLFSYEIKRELNFGNLRESFFQAVSNSSWAHQGFLAAAHIDEDPDFFSELKRLSSSFGIGVIRIAVDNPDDSEILIPARERDFVDVETMNRLAQANPKFKEFLRRIKTDLSSREVRKERYDPVLTVEELAQSIKNQRSIT